MQKKKIFLSLAFLSMLTLSSCNFFGSNSQESKDSSSDTSVSSVESSADSSSSDSKSSSSSSSSKSSSSSSSSSKSSSSSSSSSSKPSSSSSSSSQSSQTPLNDGFTFNETQLNTAQEIHTTNQLKYLNLDKPYYSMTSSDLNACDAYGNKNVSTPEKVTLSWDFTPDAGKTVSKYSVIFGQKADLSDGYTVEGTSAKSLSFYNSFLGTNYFKVVANYSDGSKKESGIRTFQVTGQAPRNLYVGNMPNCRDMGGRSLMI